MAPTGDASRKRDWRRLLWTNIQPWPRVIDWKKKVRAALADRYDVQDEVGRGGMAVVYRATDLKHDRIVAVKVLRPEIAMSLGTERFLQEIRIAAGLQHLHILPLFDSGEADGVVYYVMPFIEGETLADLLQREHRLPLEDVFRITNEVGAALQYAHSKGVVHRDIKPENIMLSGGHAVLADFGVARAFNVAGGERMTDTGLAIGTVEYMSPEQALGGDVLDGRSDIYSLGCVVYEMLVGGPPFSGLTPQAVLARHSVDPPPPIRTVRPTVNRAVEQAIGKAIAKVPADRFRNAMDFGRALERAAAREHSLSRRLGLVATVIASVLIAAVLFSVSGDPSSAGNVHTMAVLPFTNTSADSANEYFSDGITEELINGLKTLAGLRTVTRTASFAYKNSALSPIAVGRELQVEAVLTGGVRFSDDRVRIQAELLDVATGRELWSDLFERDFGDIFEIQDSIAGAIVAAMQVALAPGEEARIARSTNNEVAVDLYWQGRYQWNKRSPSALQLAGELYSRAIQEDPRYAPAYSGLAAVWTQTGSYATMSPRSVFTVGKVMAQEAIGLDSSLADAHYSMGQIQLFYDWDLEAARESFNRAIAIDDQHAGALIGLSLQLAADGRDSAAVATAQRAVSGEPLLVEAHGNLGRVLYMARRFEDAIAEFDRTLAMDSLYFRSFAWKGLSHMQLGEHDRAIASFETAARITANHPLILSGLGHVLGAAGERERAQLVVAMLEAHRSAGRFVSELFFAFVYMGLGNNDEAFRHLRAGVEERGSFLVLLDAEPIFDPIRTDPRFSNLRAQVGLQGVPD